MPIEISRVPHRPRKDPREYQDWFRRLDEEARDAVRRRWLEEELDLERLESCRRRELRRDLTRGTLLVGGVHAAIVLVVAAYLEGVTGGTSLANLALHVLLASAVGAALGGLWRWIDAGLLACALSGCVTLLLFELAVGMHWIFGVCAGLAGGRIGQFVGLRRTELPGS